VQEHENLHIAQCFIEVLFDRRDDELVSTLIPYSDDPEVDFVPNIFAAFLSPFKKMLGFSPHLYTADYVQILDTS
jgi:hypothetical protein